MAQSNHVSIMYVHVNANGMMYPLLILHIAHIIIHEPITEMSLVILTYLKKKNQFHDYLPERHPLE